MSGLHNLPAGAEIQLKALEPRSDAHHSKLPKATSCPKGKDLHFLLRRNTEINVISITHKAVVQPRSHLVASFAAPLPIRSLPRRLSRPRKQTNLLLRRYAKAIFFDFE